MLSIQRTHAAVVACHASPPALDSLPVVGETLRCRVAPDELLLVAPPSLLEATERAAAEHLAVVDPTALVLDQTDGWSGFTLRGNEAPSVFAQLSAVPLPAERPAFVQGAVAGGNAKILLAGGDIHVLVPSTLGAHLAVRLRDVCGKRALVPDTETAFAADSSMPSYRRDGVVTPALR